MELDEAPITADARSGGSLSRSLGHVVSWAGGHAMRPQTAMAAVLLLMVGSSLFFLRARPERGVSARVNVIERGIPDTREEGGPPLVPPTLPAADMRLLEEADRGLGRKRTEPTAAVAKSLTAKSAPSSAALSASPRDAAAPEIQVDPYAAAMAFYESGSFAEATRDFDAIAGSGAEKAPLAALYAAKSVQAGTGCEDAVSRYEAAAARFAKTRITGDALWGAASCHKALGHREKARELYGQLRQVAGYKDRAEKELATLDGEH